MSARRGIFVAPFDELADPRVLARLAASAEEQGFDGFFLWDHVNYRPPTSALADRRRGARGGPLPDRPGRAGAAGGDGGLRERAARRRHAAVRDRRGQPAGHGPGALGGRRGDLVSHALRRNTPRGGSTGRNRGRTRLG